jgi:threonine/homoserine/homoserine lactone efflux protein
MVGPLTISILYTSLEKGQKAGFSVAAGIWFSDILFILSVYYGFQYIVDLTNINSFDWGMGIAGSIILMLIGIGIMMKKKDFNPTEITRIRAKDLIGGFSQGFAINTFNPFTFIFWTSVMGAVILDNRWFGMESAFFFGGIMTVITVSDSAKILLSKWLTKWLTPRRWALIQKISGFSFVLFGIILLIRVALGD